MIERYRKEQDNLTREDKKTKEDCLLTRGKTRTARNYGKIIIPLKLRGLGRKKPDKRIEVKKGSCKLLISCFRIIAYPCCGLKEIDRRPPYHSRLKSFLLA